MFLGCRFGGDQVFRRDDAFLQYAVTQQAVFCHREAVFRREWQHKGVGVEGFHAGLVLYHEDRMPSLPERYAMTDTNPHSTRKTPKWLTCLIVSPLICLLICGITLWFTALRPEYVEFDIPPMEGMSEWVNIQRGQDNLGAFTVRYESECNSLCGEWDTIVHYFDDWFADQGWERIDGRGHAGPSCRMPEVYFLPIGQSDYVIYRPAGVSESVAEPIACLAVWQPEGQSNYNIVLLTANLPPLQRFGRELDYM